MFKRTPFHSLDGNVGQERPSSLPDQQSNDTFLPLETIATAAHRRQPPLTQEQQRKQQQQQQQLQRKGLAKNASSSFDGNTKTPRTSNCEAGDKEASASAAGTRVDDNKNSKGQDRRPQLIPPTTTTAGAAGATVNATWVDKTTSTTTAPPEISSTERKKRKYDKRYTTSTTTTTTDISPNKPRSPDPRYHHQQQQRHHESPKDSDMDCDSDLDAVFDLNVLATQPLPQPLLLLSSHHSSSSSLASAQANQNNNNDNNSTQRLLETYLENRADDDQVLRAMLASNNNKESSQKEASKLWLGRVIGGTHLERSDSLEESDLSVAQVVVKEQSRRRRRRRRQHHFRDLTQDNDALENDQDDHYQKGNELKAVARKKQKQGDVVATTTDTPTDVVSGQELRMEYNSTTHAVVDNDAGTFLPDLHYTAANDDNDDGDLNNRTPIIPPRFKTLVGGVNSMPNLRRPAALPPPMREQHQSQPQPHRQRQQGRRPRKRLDRSPPSGASRWYSNYDENTNNSLGSPHHSQAPHQLQQHTMLYQVPLDQEQDNCVVEYENDDDEEDDGDSEVWSQTSAGIRTRKFHLRIQGKKYTHPPLPSGWQVRISKTASIPYYCHPDHGFTWHCPVLLPKKPMALQQVETASSSPRSVCSSALNVHPGSIALDDAQQDHDDDNDDKPQPPTSPWSSTTTKSAPHYDASVDENDNDSKPSLGEAFGTSPEDNQIAYRTPTANVNRRRLASPHPAGANLVATGSTAPHLNNGDGILSSDATGASLQQFTARPPATVAVAADENNLAYTARHAHSLQQDPLFLVTPKPTTTTRGRLKTSNESGTLTTVKFPSSEGKTSSTKTSATTRATPAAATTPRSTPWGSGSVHQQFLKLGGSDEKTNAKQIPDATHTTLDQPMERDAFDSTPLETPNVNTGATTLQQDTPWTSLSLSQRLLLKGVARTQGEAPFVKTTTPQSVRLTADVLRKHELSVSRPWINDVATKSPKEAVMPPSTRLTAELLRQHELSVHKQQAWSKVSKMYPPRATTPPSAKLVSAATDQQQTLTQQFGAQTKASITSNKQTPQSAQHLAASVTVCHQGFEPKKDRTNVATVLPEPKTPQTTRRSAATLDPHQQPVTQSAQTGPSSTNLNSKAKTPRSAKWSAVSRQHRPAGAAMALTFTTTTTTITSPRKAGLNDVAHQQPKRFRHNTSPEVLPTRANEAVAAKSTVVLRQQQKFHETQEIESAATGLYGKTPPTSRRSNRKLPRVGHSSTPKAKQKRHKTPPAAEKEDSDSAVSFQQNTYIPGQDDDSYKVAGAIESDDASLDRSTPKKYASDSVTDTDIFEGLAELVAPSSRKSPKPKSLLRLTYSDLKAESKVAAFASSVASLSSHDDFHQADDVSDEDDIVDDDDDDDDDGDGFAMPASSVVSSSRRSEASRMLSSPAFSVSALTVVRRQSHPKDNRQQPKSQPKSNKRPQKEPPQPKQHPQKEPSQSKHRQQVQQRVPKPPPRQQQPQSKHQRPQQQQKQPPAKRVRLRDPNFKLCSLQNLTELMDEAIRKRTLKDRYGNKIPLREYKEIEENYDKYD